MPTLLARLDNICQVIFDFSRGQFAKSRGFLGIILKVPAYDANFKTMLVQRTFESFFQRQNGRMYRIFQFDIFIEATQGLNLSILTSNLPLLQKGFGIDHVLANGRSLPSKVAS